jgi:hypothetical protein
LNWKKEKEITSRIRKKRKAKPVKALGTTNGNQTVFIG